MTYVVDLDEGEARFFELCEHAASGERVVITRAGLPVAELVPHRGRSAAASGPPRGERRPGSAAA